jgi:hypothetical protein
MHRLTSRERFVVVQAGKLILACLLEIAESLYNADDTGYKR